MPTTGATPHLVRRSPIGRLWRAARILGAFLIVTVLALGLAGAGLYFMLRDQAIENEALNRNIESRIQDLVGQQFRTTLGPTSVAFSADGLLSIVSRDAKIMDPARGVAIANIGKLFVGLKLSSLLTGNPVVDSIVIDDATVKTEVFFAAGPALTQGVTVRDVINETGARLARAASHFGGDKLNRVRLRNTRLVGNDIGGIGSGMIVEDLEIRRTAGKPLTLTSKLNTEHSQISVAGEYTTSDSTSGNGNLKVEGISLREWLGDPEVVAPDIGANGIASLSMSISTGDGTPDGQASAALTISQTPIRVGIYSESQVDSVALNFRAIPQKNQVELELSKIIANGFEAYLIGGVRPWDDRLGYSGPLRYEVIADPAIGAPYKEGEKAADAAIRVHGKIDLVERSIEADEIVVLHGDDRLTGTAKVTYEQASPAIVADIASDGFDFTAFRQLWPFFIASQPKSWVDHRVTGGRLTDVRLTANVPAGVIGHFYDGKKMGVDQFNLEASFNDAEINAFGELPHIRKAAGKFRMQGMKLEANLSSGEASPPDGNTVKLTSARYTVGDIGVRPAQAELAIAMEGDLRGLVSIAAQKPLDVPKRFNAKPSQFSGRASADVIVRFPMTNAVKESEITWSAIIETRDASSSEPMFDRKVSSANLVIEANREQFAASGKLNIDGAAADLKMVEPLVEGGPAAERIVKMTLDEKARKSLGFSLAPIITGPVKLEIKRSGAKPEVYKMDLAEADMALPWVGWRKGSGIRSIATFQLARKDSGVQLNDFYLDGPGFSATGKLVFDKAGIVSADFADLSLNEGDSLSLEVKRNGKTLNIQGDGLRFDARSLVNKLIHEGTFGEDAGAQDISVTGNVKELRGFGDVVLRNVTMSYNNAAGGFGDLSIRGTFNEKAFASIVANTTKGKTDFDIDTTDAGAMLRMVDIYRLMRGGRMQARLTRSGAGPFVGPVRIADFNVTGEPRLSNFVSAPVANEGERGASLAVTETLKQVNTKNVRFIEGRATIEKGDGYLKLNDGILTSGQFGFTYEGSLYDQKNHMDLSGTFMPAVSLSRAIGVIPLVGEIFGNGRDSSLIGITYRLRGPAKEPKVEVNPISVVAPGVFRKVFEFRN